MLIISKNKIGAYSVFPFVKDVRFHLVKKDSDPKFENYFEIEEFVSDFVEVKNSSYSKHISLIYLVDEKKKKGIVKTEYVNATLYLKSGLKFTLYNLSKCNYKENKEKEIVNIDIGNTDYSNISKLSFSELDVDDIHIFKVKEVMEYDMTEDLIFPKDKNSSEEAVF